MDHVTVFLQIPRLNNQTVEENLCLSGGDILGVSDCLEDISL